MISQLLCSLQSNRQCPSSLPLTAKTKEKGNKSGRFIHILNQFQYFVNIKTKFSKSSSLRECTDYNGLWWTSGWSGELLHYFLQTPSAIKNNCFGISKKRTRNENKDGNNKEKSNLCKIHSIIQEEKKGSHINLITYLLCSTQRGKFMQMFFQWEPHAWRERKKKRKANQWEMNTFYVKSHFGNFRKSC